MLECHCWVLLCAGTVFLSSQPAVMTAVIRALVPPNMEELQMEEDEMLTLTVSTVWCVFMWLGPHVQWNPSIVAIIGE